MVNTQDIGIGDLVIAPKLNNARGIVIDAETRKVQPHNGTWMLVRGPDNGHRLGEDRWIRLELLERA